MRSLILGIYVIVTSGCGGSVELSVIGDTPDGGQAAGGSTATNGAPPEQKLSSLLADWCPQICAKLIQCLTPGIDSTCETDCNSAIKREFLGRGDACAQYGLDFVNCLNSASCNQVNNDQVCDPYTPAEGIACGSGTGVNPPPSTNPPMPAVTCQSQSGLAAAGNPPIGSTVCDNSYSDCNDGHTYRFSCVNQGNNQLGCTCYWDGAPQTPFVTSGTGCPPMQAMDTACGWQL